MILLQIEIATANYPYGASKAVFEQLSIIVKDPPPSLPTEEFTDDFRQFIEQW